MIIRLARNSDGEAVVRLVSRLMEELGFEGVDGKGLGEVFKDLVGGEGQGFAMVAEKDGKIIAICTVSGVIALRTRGIYGIVQEMYVSPELRGRGIGAELLQATLRQAQLLGCSMVEVGTPPEGVRQGRFYRRAGFKRFGDRFRYTVDAAGEIVGATLVVAQ